MKSSAATRRPTLGIHAPCGPHRSPPAPPLSEPVRLVARANLLLDQGNIGDARNMLGQSGRDGQRRGLFWLAETYDPLLLSARKNFGTQSDIAKTRELYAKTLASGVSKAKCRLQALQQWTGDMKRRSGSDQ